MSFDAALRDLLQAPGLPPSDVADRMAGVRNRMTFYRVPSGAAPSAVNDTVDRGRMLRDDGSIR